MEHGNVRFGRDFLAEFDQGRAIVRIPRGDVQRIALRWGVRSPRPLVQAALGGSLLLAGCYLFIRVFLELIAEGGTVPKAFFLGIVTLALLGGGLLLDLCRRGFYLEVLTRAGVERLRFDRRLSEAEIAAFLAAVRSRLGWIIEMQAYEAIRRG